jgi:anti-sigma factor ChrR (cupin superfamily)
MTLHITTDADYWNRIPADLRPLLETSNAQGLTVTMHVLGDSSDENAPSVMVIKMPPGWVLPAHAHVADRLEVVLEGSIMAGDRVLRPGDIMTAGNGEVYGPHEVGPEGCTTLEVFSSRRGSHTLVFDFGEGQQEVDIANPEQASAIPVPE